MSYLGNTPTTQSFISGTDYFDGTGAQTAFTLSRTVNSVNDIQVTVNNVVQQPNDAYTLSGTTLTMTSAPSAGTNNVYVRYLSTTTQVITPSQNTVSWNTLDSNIQQDLGVMYKNRIINGNMAIDQRRAGAATANTINGYTLDRWYVNQTVTGKLIAQQNAGSVTPPSGFVNYLGITSQSAYSILSSDQYYIDQAIEGYNIADLNWGTANAKSVTLSFWVRSSLTGTFGGSVSNSAVNRSYPFSYTISSANTWEYKTVTIAGDTTGTWLTTNGVGMYVFLGLGVGSTFSGTAGSWAGAFYASVTGATSVVGTNGATWYITGVQLEVGTQATAFTTAGGSYGAEFALCQRYYESTFPVGTAPAQNTAATNALRISQTAAAAAPCRGFTWLFKTTKRTSPSTITSYNPAAANANVRNVTRSNDATISGVAALNAMGITFTFTGSTGSAVGDDNAVGFSADAEL